MKSLVDGESEAFGHSKAHLTHLGRSCVDGKECLEMAGDDWAGVAHYTGSKVNLHCPCCRSPSTLI